jgi:glycosyltransferase involved in cell wall biosynthesis
VPVVGFDVPGVRDVVGWGGGELVPEAAGAAGLAAALRALQRDPVRRERAVAAGRAALPRFAPAAVAAELQRHYAEALARIGYAAGDRG